MAQTSAKLLAEELKEKLADSSNIVTDGTIMRQMSLAWLFPNQKLSHSIYIKLSTGFVLFRAEGDIISAGRLQELRKHGTHFVFVPKTDWKNAVSAQDDFVQQISSKPTPESATTLRDLILSYQEEVHLTNKLEIEHYDRMLQLAYLLSDMLEKKPKFAPALLIHSKNPTEYLFFHNVNVAILCAAIGVKLRVSGEALQELTFGALLHNIGNLFLPKELLDNEEKLTEEELEVIKTHPQKGAEHLKSLQSPERVTLMALQHHERCDGNGYPNGKKKDDIDGFARICAIADTFDALISIRPQAKQPTVPELALQLLQMMGKKLDTTMLKVSEDILRDVKKP